ncbi:MAG TPA: bifunctional UDP-N-acetylglucosamine diphosphorylase/glucosamine-1-phosphate N-acetyltransferase GlmU [Myxococcota bacterium]
MVDVAASRLFAILLAAGKGTRMKSALPKVLHPVLGKPLVSWAVDAVVAAGASDVVAVIGHGAGHVASVLKTRHGDRVSTVVQEQQNGTGHAVLCALPAVPADVDDVLIVCGDTPRLGAAELKALVALRRRDAALLALWTTRVETPKGYGRIVRDASQPAGHVVGIVEEKDATEQQRAITEINPGVYCVEAAFLRRALPKLTANNAAGELYLTDLVALAVGERADAIAALDVDVDLTQGINDRVQLSEAEQWARARRARQLRLDGVTIVDERTVTVDSDVVVGIDVTIEPGVALTGKTRIGNNVHIGQGAVITDCVIDDDVVIHPYSVCDKAHVRSKAVVGPFARLRPDADVGEGAHVGNFVELKKTVLGSGSKANHLAYLGDAVIGTGVNVGAGTITCNYDGIGKHQTVLGDDVFVGSNSTLVAPVLVGKGAYIGAASVITENVPADALALGRARQVTKERRAAEIREKNAARAGKKH